MAVGSLGRSFALSVSTSRQANENVEAQDYSIPQQREYGTAFEEFVDAGASLRSANRPELRRMLALLEATARDKSLPRIDYVIVYKLDRLAGDRPDDVTIRNAGATLVSVAERIDENPGRHVAADR